MKPALTLPTGIELIRRVARMSAVCSETFLERFSAPELVELAEAWIACEWDYSPEVWDEGQIQAAICSGAVPRFDEFDRAV